MESARSVGLSGSNFICIVSGIGERLLLDFEAGSPQNYGCHGNIKLPLTYNEEILFRGYRLHFYRILVKLASNEDNDKFLDEFDFGNVRTIPFGVIALERRNFSHRFIMEKMLGT